MLATEMSAELPVAHVPLECYAGREAGEVVSRFGGKQSRQTRKFACFGRARCETLRLGGKQSLPWYSTMQDAMVGREQSRKTRKFACFGITRRKTLWLGGSKAGKLVSLPASV